MTYRPADAVFGPPWPVWFPSLALLTLAVMVATLVFLAERAPSTSQLFIYFVERDAHRVLGSRVFASALLVSGVASVLRTAMRGVRLRGDGVEYRDVLALGWPRVRVLRWAQIDGIVLDQKHHIALDLWDGTRTFLPRVMDRDSLARALEHVGHARAIPVRGGRGLDDLEPPVFAD